MQRRNGKWRRWWSKSPLSRHFNWLFQVGACRAFRYWMTFLVLIALLFSSRFLLFSFSFSSQISISSAFISFRVLHFSSAPSFHSPLSHSFFSFLPHSLSSAALYLENHFTCIFLCFLLFSLSISTHPFTSAITSSLPLTPPPPLHLSPSHQGMRRKTGLKTKKRDNMERRGAEMRGRE